MTRPRSPSGSICKGPPGWPGVFVQSTKEVGLAREVGLRPGDQILQCNGVSFIDIDFAKVTSGIGEKFALLLLKFLYRKQ